MKLALKKYRDFRGSDRAVHWTSSKPFIKNSRGILIHRPKYVLTYKSLFGSVWLIVGHWCGSGVNGSDNLKFLDEPPIGEMLCTRCEAKAISEGFPSAHELVGRHVHTGGMNTIFCDVC